MNLQKHHQRITQRGGVVRVNLDKALPVAKSPTTSQGSDRDFMGAKRSAEVSQNRTYNQMEVEDAYVLNLRGKSQEEMMEDQTRLIETSGQQQATNAPQLQPYSTKGVDYHRKNETTKSMTAIEIQQLLQKGYEETNSNFESNGQNQMQ